MFSFFWALLKVSLTLSTLIGVPTVINPAGSGPAGDAQLGQRAPRRGGGPPLERPHFRAYPLHIRGVLVGLRVDHDVHQGAPEARLRQEHRDARVRVGVLRPYLRHPLGSLQDLPASLGCRVGDVGRMPERKETMLLGLLVLPLLPLPHRLDEKVVRARVLMGERRQFVPEPQEGFLVPVQLRPVRLVLLALPRDGADHREQGGRHGPRCSGCRAPSGGRLVRRQLGAEAPEPLEVGQDQILLSRTWVLLNCLSLSNHLVTSQSAYT